MPHDTPTEDSFQAVEMAPGKCGAMTSEFPTGAVAQAWMDEHSRQLTWADLTTWLSEAKDCREPGVAAFTKETVGAFDGVPSALMPHDTVHRGSEV